MSMYGRTYSVCYNKIKVYTGEDVENPYVGYYGPKPPYNIRKSEDNAFLYDGIELASDPGEEFSNTKVESQSSSGLTEGLTTSNNQWTSNTENQPLGQLNGMSTNDINIQPPSTIKLASSNFELLPNDGVASNNYYGVLSNGEPVVPDISNSIPPPAGSLPVPWMA
ncbi:hypothetical protein MMC07_000208 [Pseudocyphellaria aurata]|nr:hypothetical protein [Pseudocyphellaria aurata]